MGIGFRVREIKKRKWRNVQGDELNWDEHIGFYFVEILLTVVFVFCNFSLEWHKTIREGLKEYCALIDSSSSFRAYRLALAETNPPCIPYMWVSIPIWVCVGILGINELSIFSVVLCCRIWPLCTLEIRIIWRRMW